MRNKKLTIIALLLPLSGCMSIQTPDHSIPISFTYQEEGGGIYRKQTIFMKETAVPDTSEPLQPYRNNIIANSQIKDCSSHEVCRIIPAYVYIEYKMKFTNQGYVIHGHFNIDATLKSNKKSPPLSSVSFEISESSPDIVTVSNEFGSTLLIQRKGF